VKLALMTYILTISPVCIGTSQRLGFWRFKKSLVKHNSTVLTNGQEITENSHFGSNRATCS